MGGKWSSPTAWVVPAFRSRGYTVVSVGYRMLPHVGIKDIMTDVRTAYAWCMDNLPRLVGADPCAGVIAGASAGATAALLAGFDFDPKPKAVINVYGMVDMLDPSHHTTLPFKADPYITSATEGELAEAMKTRDPSKALVQCPWAGDLPPVVPLEVTRAHLGLPEYTPTDATFFHLDLVTYMVKKRIMLRTLFRCDETADDSVFRATLRAWNPLDRLANDVEVARAYPPTFILHGSADQFVPLHEATKMAAILRRAGVAVGEAYPEGMDHCFDWAIGVSWTEIKIGIPLASYLLEQSPKDEGWVECVIPMLDFLDAHLRGPT